MDPVGKVVEDSVFGEERDRGQIAGRGFEAEAWLDDVLLQVVLCHLVYLRLGRLSPTKERK